MEHSEPETTTRGTAVLAAEPFRKDVTIEHSESETTTHGTAVVHQRSRGSWAWTRPVVLRCSAC
jgi:hypothetical protein